MTLAGKKTTGNPIRGFAWIHIALAGLCLALAPMAQAGQYSLILNGKAIHFEQPEGDHFNERNWGAGIQYDFDRIGDEKNWIPFVTASGFLDSYENPSYYAGGGIVRRYDMKIFEQPYHVDLGVVGFLMTREDFKDNKPFPGILPVLSFGSERIAMNITYVPRVHPKLIPLVFLQIKIGLFGRIN